MLIGVDHFCPECQCIKNAVLKTVLLMHCSKNSGLKCFPLLFNRGNLTQEIMDIILNFVQLWLTDGLQP